MPWLKLSISTEAGQVDTLSALLEQFEPVSISFNPESDEQLYAGVDEPPEFWNSTSVSVLLDTAVDTDILLACIRNRIGTDNIHHHSIELLEDQNWSEAGKAGYGAMVFAGRLEVRPSWVPSTPDLPCSIVLDPGLAFGTGRHNTTSLCLEWLAENNLAGKTVIDYGCGSGILAVAAARLGAERVHAVDIDSQAVSATRDNAARNDLTDCITVGRELAPGMLQADCLIANILLNPLLELAPLFGSVLKPGGRLVLSGILASQVETCRQAYGNEFVLEEPRFSNEWALIHGIRLAPPD